MTKRFLVALAAACIACAGLAACGSSSQSASSVVSSDGYQVSGGAVPVPSGAGQYISSTAGGNKGSDGELVFVCTSSTDADVLGNAIAVLELNEPAGMTVTNDGDVVRVRGTVSELTQLGNAMP
jgi:ABC-type phosphate/phosphonate transport system substrate-binding protein